MAPFEGHTAAPFPPTQWTLLRRLAYGSDEDMRWARERLAEVYWPPVYAWFRRQGMSRDRAAEATQGFFTQVVLGRSLFERADAQRGRLRALLATALRNFHLEDLQRATRRARVLVLPPDHLEAEERRLARIGSAHAPDEAFNARWAVSVLQEALRRCRRHYLTSGPERYWQAFDVYTLRPHVSGNRPPSLAVVARSAGFKNAAHAAVAVFHVRKRCRALLAEVISETAESEADRQAEYAALLAYLGVE